MQRSAQIGIGVIAVAVIGGGIYAATQGNSYPNVYGIDMPTRSELVAHGRDVNEIAEEIGADKVIYQDLNDLVQSVRQFNPVIEAFDTSVFDGKYVTKDVNEAYFEHIEHERKFSEKDRADADNESIGLHNNYKK